MRESVRGLVLDADDRLLLIRRVRPGRAPYLTLPGGGVEPGDADDRATLARELAEEAGLFVTVGPEVLAWDDGPPTHARHRVRLARVTGRVSGWAGSPESADPAKGSYELLWVAPPERDEVARELQPAALAALVRDPPSAWLAWWGAPSAGGGTGSGTR